MDLERFGDFILNQAARHESEMADLRAGLADLQLREFAVREDIASLAHTAEILVDNQVQQREDIERLKTIFQEGLDILTKKLLEESDTRQYQYEITHASMRETQASLRETQASARDMHAVIGKLARTMDQHIDDPMAHAKAS